MQKNCYPTAISATSRCLAERRDPSVAVQNTYISLKGVENQDMTPEIVLLVCWEVDVYCTTKLLLKKLSSKNKLPLVSRKAGIFLGKFYVMCDVF